MSLDISPWISLKLGTRVRDLRYYIIPFRVYILFERYSAEIYRARL